MTAFLLTTLHQLSYPGLFLLLAGSAIVLPIPEEIILLTAGYLTAIGVVTFYWGIPVSIAGLLIGDVFLFTLARFGGEYAQKLRARVNKIGLDKTWIFSPQQPLRAVFILRFLTGFRFIAPIYAGFEQASWKGYLLVDILGIIIFVPLMFAFGYEFHNSIVAFIAGFEIVRHAVFIFVLALAGVGMLPSLYRSFKTRLIKK